MPALVADVVFAQQKRKAPELTSKVSRARVTAPTRDPVGMALLLMTARDSMEEKGLAASTRAHYLSADRYFVAFCLEMEIDYYRFGMAECDGGFSAVQENRILELFAVYVVNYPRVAGKELNTGETAATNVTGLKHCVEERTGRRPGRPPGENRSLCLTLQGLRKEAPRGERPRPEPILQKHLRAVRALLDLKGNARHRVLWAFWLQCWQTVCRASDLIRGNRRAAYLRWDPALDLHRGRHRFERIEGSAPGEPRHRSIIDLPPGIKTDPGHDKHYRKTAPVDGTPDALSCGAAVHAMLLGDPMPGVPPEQVPLFRDPATGRELSYTVARIQFAYCLRLAGYPELARGLHSLRRGGATAAAAVAGDFAAGAMGLWESETKYDYMWALRDRLEAASLAMGRGDSGPLANGAAGPVGRPPRPFAR